MIALKNKTIAHNLVPRVRVVLSRSLSLTKRIAASGNEIEYPIVSFYRWTIQMAVSAKKNC